MGPLLQSRLQPKTRLDPAAIGNAIHTVNKSVDQVLFHAIRELRPHAEKFRRLASQPPQTPEDAAFLRAAADFTHAVLGAVMLQDASDLVGELRRAGFMNQITIPR